MSNTVSSTLVYEFDFSSRVQGRGKLGPENGRTMRTKRRRAMKGVSNYRKQNAKQRHLPIAQRVFV